MCLRLNQLDPPRIIITKKKKERKGIELSLSQFQVVAVDDDVETHFLHYSIRFQFNLRSTLYIQSSVVKPPLTAVLCLLSTLLQVFLLCTITRIIPTDVTATSARISRRSLNGRWIFFFFFFFFACALLCVKRWVVVLPRQPQPTPPPLLYSTHKLSERSQVKLVYINARACVDGARDRLPSSSCTLILSALLYKM